MRSAAKSADGTRAEHHAAHREMLALRTELLDVLMLCQSRVVTDDGQKIVLAEFWACMCALGCNRHLYRGLRWSRHNVPRYRNYSYILQSYAGPRHQHCVHNWLTNALEVVVERQHLHMGWYFSRLLWVT